jgi:hypothetical protein
MRVNPTVDFDEIIECPLCPVHVGVAKRPQGHGFLEVTLNNRLDHQRRRGSHGSTDYST